MSLLEQTINELLHESTLLSALDVTGTVTFNTFMSVFFLFLRFVFKNSRTQRNVQFRGSFDIILEMNYGEQM